MDDPLLAITADDTRNTSVRDGSALPDDTAQPMAALRLDHDIHILSGCKSGAKGDGQRCHITGGAKVLLGQNGIHQYIRLCLCHAAACRVDEDGHRILCPDGRSLFQCVDTNSPQALYRCFTFVHSFAE